MILLGDDTLLDHDGGDGDQDDSGDDDDDGDDDGDDDSRGCSDDDSDRYLPLANRSVVISTREEPESIYVCVIEW